jgi:NADH:ubiquinone oxidoreductase subunit 2 (subunit N)
VSFYYYLKVLKQIYVVAEDKGNKTKATAVSLLPQVVLLVMAILVIVLGCFPNLLVGPLHDSLLPGH